MAGTDHNVDVIGDWAPSNPSPRTLFSTLLADDVGSRSFSNLPPEENGSKGVLRGSEKQSAAADLSNEDEAGDEDSLNLMSGFNLFSGQKSSSLGGLAERMAARAGFNAPKLNTARIRSANLLSPASPEGHSLFLTIPSGLSPTTLLDSPVFLSNALAQQSPTTGKFPLTQCNNRSSFFVPEAPDKKKDEDADTASFVFKPHMELNSLYLPSAANKGTSTSHQRQMFLPNINVSVQPSHCIEATKTHSQNQQEFSEAVAGKDTFGNITSEARVSNDIGNADHSSRFDDQDDGGDQRGENPSLAANGLSDDGYNWRKYGQKQVKGSEFPRSYYKCTHSNCQVKKKVERSHEGQITEIIYKGTHNHPKPPPNRRLVVGSSNSITNMDIAEQPSAQGGFSGESAWADTQQGAATTGPDWRHDGMETASSASAATELDPSASMPTMNSSRFEPAEPIDISSTLSNDDDDDDQATHNSISLGCDEDGDESESKRRKIDTSVMEISGATRAIREPRVVVQTTSEVDILDDGYRWRKYGQKVVKGNPNPRSYYKCTNAGCTVRKHVERASHDLKSVITTYEGKHNHDVPAARNSSHANSGTSSAAPPPPAASIPRPEPSSQLHHSMARFDGSSLGKLAPAGRPPLGPMSNYTAFGMNHINLANLAMAGLGPGQVRLPLNMPMNHYLGQHKVNETGFMMPKGEPKEETMSESGHPVSTAAIYNQMMMSRLPLGPHL
ncbi:hypothetical protein MRB53_029673 [Persea americana]|uniref:Uncharacterized protein n=1 Tax=Persea americana TaxID=3435 RepID=A0ACC2KJ35_PERAE|nr:hypothetical protein MRB53_029673 [Persea americana]WJJ45888.1 WRKY38 [Persea americana]